ncbi:MAG: hypothetical protein AB1486_21345 [Planctomycetota bacterium]
MLLVPPVALVFSIVGLVRRGDPLAAGIGLVISGLTFFLRFAGPLLRLCS